MYYDSHPESLRQVVAERHESLRRAAYVARVQREARARRPRRRRRWSALLARQHEHHPALVAPPPALAE